MALRLCKIEITLSLQSISKEVHGRAARGVKTYGIPVKLRILPPDVRSENGPFRTRYGDSQAVDFGSKLRGFKPKHWQLSDCSKNKFCIL